MLLINILLLLIFIGLYIKSMKGPVEGLETLDKKEHKLYLFYPMSHFLLTKTRVETLLLRNIKVAKAVTALTLTGKPEMEQRLYWYSKTSLVLFILFLFNLLSLFGQLSTPSTQSIYEGKYLERPDYGEGSRELELSVSMKGVNQSSTSAESSYSMKEDDQEDVIYSEDIIVRIKEREYTEQELEKVIEEAVLYLETEVLGENKSMDMIQEDLKFINLIPGTSIKVEWYPLDYTLISGEGRVMNEDITQAGATTSVTAVITYRDFQMKHRLQFHILPKELTEKEKLLKDLEKELRKQSERTRRERRWKLPDQLGEYELLWEEKKKDIGANLLFLGLFTAAMVWFYYDKELDSRMKKRKNQMIFDYPEIINKFTLLVNAGMTIKQAWIKIAEDYSNISNIRLNKKRFAYEEMLVTSHELKLGVAEGNAYEQFGRRTGILPYMKFSSLIAQNLKKGNRGLAELLSREAQEAFEDRKELAKRLGEEAETKLLGPMMVMLLIVLIIILIPAFLSFRI